MDFNDLQVRLRRLYVSVDSLSDFDVLGNTNYNIHEIENGKQALVVSFGKLKQEEILNKTFVVLGLIHGLKDHLIKALGSTSVSKEKVEALFNSEELAIISDLVNAEKHGYPLTKYKRSNKDPRIGFITQAAAFGGGGSVTIDSEGRQQVNGNVKIVISGDIVDRQGKDLGSLEDIINKAVSVLEKFINVTGLVRVNG